jgi:N-acetylglucosaminyl-diphospho-decaprenol L-rhamnosyltransferase
MTVKEATIVIVTHNSAAHICKCLKSILSGKHQVSANNIILIDNNSSDDTIALAAKYGPFIIKNTSNLGYAKAANIGIMASKSEYVLLLNPDVCLKKDTIQKMLAFMKHNPRCDIQGPRLLSPTGKLILSCRRFPTFRAMIGRRLNIFRKEVNAHLMVSFDHSSPIAVDWVSGACMLFKRKFMLDERYFLYFEDVDFCHGKRVFYNPGAVAYHGSQRDSAKRLSMFIIHLVSMLKYKFKHL